MFPENTPKILPGAIFIADAHYNPLGRTELIGFLEAIASGRVSPPQLFLMGDIADVLIGPFAYCRERNKPLIDAVNRIAGRGVEVWFFEGNHDFMLEGVFGPKVHIVPKTRQPAPFDFDGKRALLLHGDFRVELRYAIYAAVIRNPIGLWLIHLLTLNFWKNRMLKKMERSLQAKKLCYRIEKFEQKRSGRLQDLAQRADILIEGHFHQAQRFEIGSCAYENLPAFACGQRFGEVESTDKGVSLSVKEWGVL